MKKAVKQRKYKKHQKIQMEKEEEVKEIENDQETKQEEQKEQKEQESDSSQKIIPVDEYFPNKIEYHVYQNDDEIYDCLMNQTNIQQSRNNNKVTLFILQINKFYIAQVLESDSNPKKYFLYTRWGRVGVRGQDCAKQAPLEDCLLQYRQKIHDKSVKGDYRVLQKAYVEQKLVKEEIEPSKLDKRVQNFIKLIFDKQMMNKQMVELGYDSERAPLGKLGQDTIQKGYKILESISKEVKKKKPDKNELEFLTSEFYSYIPHNIGFQQAPLINTNKKIKEKLEMLASLEQIQIATKLLDKTNSIDQNYEKLNCGVTPLDHESEKYKKIVRSVKGTHGATHSNYTLEVEEIYELEKDQKHEDCGEHELLWHGSRLTNFVGILSQGLRIAPPEAPVTGYMFGKGIYFADMISKSANYCCSSYDNPKGCILLCDVSLGECNKKYYADYYANELPAGKSSTKGCGRFIPQEYTEIDGCRLAVGDIKKEENLESSLLYNEFIVYKVEQVRMKYVLILDFKYK